MEGAQNLQGIWHFFAYLAPFDLKRSEIIAFVKRPFIRRLTREEKFDIFHGEIASNHSILQLIVNFLFD